MAQWVVKNPPANAGDAGSIPGLERSPGVGNGNPLQSVFHLPGKFRGQRSLVGYSPWGHRVRHNWATNTFFFFLYPKDWLLQTDTKVKVKGYKG